MAGWTDKHAFPIMCSSHILCAKTISATAGKHPETSRRLVGRFRRLFDTRYCIAFVLNWI
jgi:hypothetical protein